MTELSTQEVQETEGGFFGEWGSVLFDLYYGNGAGWVHYKCGEAWNRRHNDIDASLNTGVQA
ncbi:hypothetical protein [Psychroflexus sediminis]|uniref:hypothetical protein n=1 Tax=Psychroflexus sediminis TaxID=470826 RepID=UPI0015A21F90|nr:hypothetical protein [Psychroflexus sediminis]